MKTKNNKKNKGFTFIEILVGMALVIVLSASMFQVIKISNTEQGLIINAEKVKSSIRMAQSYALSVPQDATELQHVCGYGIEFIDSQNIGVYYLYISDNDFEDYPTECNNLTSNVLQKEQWELIILEGDHEIDTSLSNEIFFKSPYGKVFSDGSSLTGSSEASVIIENTVNNETKVININGAGKIDF